MRVRGLICASSGGIPEIAKLARTVEFFPAGNADALAQKMNSGVDVTSTMAARRGKVPDASKLYVPFREEVYRRKISSGICANKSYQGEHQIVRSLFRGDELRK